MFHSLAVLLAACSSLSCAFRLVHHGNKHHGAKRAVFNQKQKAAIKKHVASFLRNKKDAPAVTGAVTEGEVDDAMHCDGPSGMECPEPLVTAATVALEHATDDWCEDAGVSGMECPAAAAAAGAEAAAAIVTGMEQELDDYCATDPDMCAEIDIDWSYFEDHTAEILDV